MFLFAFVWLFVEQKQLQEGVGSGNHAIESSSNTRL